jgi:hypothetical protein
MTRGFRVADFNDSCAGYGEIERVLRAAQELARADIAAAQLVQHSRIADSNQAAIDG